MKKNKINNIEHSSASASDGWDTLNGFLLLLFDCFVVVVAVALMLMLVPVHFLESKIRFIFTLAPLLTKGPRWCVWVYRPFSKWHIAGVRDTQNEEIGTIRSRWVMGIRDSCSLLAIVAESSTPIHPSTLTRNTERCKERIEKDTGKKRKEKCNGSNERSDLYEECPYPIHSLPFLAAMILYMCA